MAESSIKVGMSFGTFGDIMAKASKLQETRQNYDKEDESFSFTMNCTDKKKGNANLYFRSTLTPKTHHTYFEATFYQDGTGYFGEDSNYGIDSQDPMLRERIRDFKCTTIVDEKNRIKAIDLDGDGFVGKGEIFDLEM